MQCAKRGNPTGGPEDETPPVLLRADPELNTTHFNEERIRLYFDEYVKDFGKKLTDAEIDYAKLHRFIVFKN